MINIRCDRSTHILGVKLLLKLVCLWQLLEKRLWLWDLSLTLGLRRSFFVWIDRFLKIWFLQLGDSRSFGCWAWIGGTLQSKFVLFLLLHAYNSALRLREIELRCLLLLHIIVRLLHLIYVFVSRFRHLGSLRIFLLYKIFHDHLFFFFFKTFKKIFLIELILLIHSCLVRIDCMLESLMLLRRFLLIRAWYRLRSWQTIALIECLWVDTWARSLFYCILALYIHWVW